MMLQFLMVLGIPTGASLLITPLVIRFANQIGAVDQPNERKIHTHPVPRLGGIVIYSSFFLSFGLIHLIDPSLRGFESLVSDRSAMLTVGLALVLGLGIFDDLRPRTPTQKLVVQLIAGTLAYLAGFKISAVIPPAGSGILNLELLNYPLTLLWIVGITNAFNLIDGLDGLAAGVGVITCFTIFGVSLATSNIPTALTVLILAGALIGFLKYNFNPARIFLGDSGSLFLGFALAVLSMESSTKGSTVLAILVPILSLGMPIIETLLSVLRRLLDSLLPHRTKSMSAFQRLMRIMTPDNEHIHHRLISRGLSHKKAVLVLYLLSCAFGAGAFTLVLADNLGTSLILIAVTIATVITIRELRYKEMAVLRNGILLPIYDWPLMNHRFSQAFFDLAFILIAYASAYVVVLRGKLTVVAEQNLLFTLPLVALIKLVVFVMVGQYRGTLRFPGVGGAVRTLKAVILSSLSTLVVLMFLIEPPRYPGSPVLVLDFFFLLSLAGGQRVSYSILRHLFHREQHQGKRVIVYGADINGILTLNQILSDRTLNLTPLGFLDESPQLEGRRVDGYPVFGGHWKLHRLLKKDRVEEILLSSDKIKPVILERIKRMARNQGIPVRRFRTLLDDVSLEPINSSLSHQSTPSDVRDLHTG
jgi:UDP-GlcNAc:undecaprenyl-phosphate GlcNAc-1-phosphate transferase